MTINHEEIRQRRNHECDHPSVTLRVKTSSWLEEITAAAWAKPIMNSYCSDCWIAIFSEENTAKRLFDYVCTNGWRKNYEIKYLKSLDAWCVRYDGLGFDNKHEEEAPIINCEGLTSKQEEKLFETIAVAFSEQELADLAEAAGKDKL